MPATQVTPSLHRLLSRSLLSNCTIQQLSLTERLQNFRACVQFEIAGRELPPLPILLFVSRGQYHLQIQLEASSVNAFVLNRGGSLTKWVTQSEGVPLSFRQYVSCLSPYHPHVAQLDDFLDTIESVDLNEVFLASRDAIPTTSYDAEVQKRYAISPNGGHFVFSLDALSGHLSCVTQEGDAGEASFPHVTMQVDSYGRFEGAVDVPEGILSDLSHMIDASMESFGSWSREAQECIKEIFEDVDRDSDGYVSGPDVSEQLVRAGQTEENAARTVDQMVGLLSSEGRNPSEEFDFHLFCGFWMTMLRDGQAVDSEAQVPMIQAFRGLFYGVSM
jgi:hypothetical protein